jgi:hypothetical protein
MHRLATTAFLAFFSGACTVIPKDDGAGGAGGAPACDGKNDCGACSACASQMLCALELDACNKNSACVAIDQCVSQLCGTDLMCKQQCVDQNPNGIAAYDAATRCLYCNQCPSDCAGYRKCE